MFQQQAEQELFVTVKAFHACKQEDGQSVSTYVLKIKAYLDQIERLGYPMPLVLRVNMILTLLSKDYDQFVQNYNMHDIGKTILELHAMLKLTEKELKKNKSSASGTSDAKPSENTSLHQHEVEHDTVEPQTDVIPVRRSARIPHAPERYGFYIDAEEHELGDHGEPPNYRAALSDPEFEKWLEAMNAKMQSIKDNQVWSLVNLPPNCKIVGSKWLFKKKTDMDGNIHTYKARLVAKGFTQTYRVDYEETFSPVADIKAIRILIAIALYYDYEIWQMDVKTAFLNGRLNKDIYMVQPEGMDTSKRGTIPMQPNVDLSNTQGPSTPAEVKRKKGIPYASALGSIMYAVRGAVDWKSFKQSTTTMSSMEAEYIAAVEAAMEPIWIRKFIFGLGVVPSIDKPMDMYCDNTCAITVADKPGVQKDDNLADPFTKPMPCTKHVEHSRRIRLKPAALMVVESEVLNDFPRFFGILIMEFTAGDAVILTLKMKGDMIVKNLDLKRTIDAMMRDFLYPSRWKELSKETSSKILPCGDGSRWKTLKSMERASVLHQPNGVELKRYHVVPYGELDGIHVALVARFGAVSKSANMILVSYGG
uniref:Putative retrotransposon Ty1-copia subclass protein n=1 Tax=Tanacetum cinerariifolium TaxID=118510 RepID=A0A699H2C5_TANCI|nr:putative retrotransposon Ty1-copia subclass protein [Tanacetum cinerariifolium]